MIDCACGMVLGSAQRLADKGDDLAQTVCYTVQKDEDKDEDTCQAHEVSYREYVEDAHCDGSGVSAARGVVCWVQSYSVCRYDLKILLFKYQRFICV